MVADRTVDLECHSQRIQIRFAHLRGPPQARVREDELRELIGSEGDVFGFVGGEFDFLLESYVFDLAFQFALYRLLGAVLQLSGDGELRGIIGGQVQFRNDRGIAQRDRAAGGEVDFAPQTHVLVGRRGIPVDEGDGEIVLRGREDLHGENIFGAGLQRLW